MSKKKQTLDKPQKPDFRVGAVSRRINEILAKFENGVELYQTNAIFANCVESLLRGSDVYKMLESVIVMHYEQQKRYKELIESGTLRTEIVVTKERFDEIADVSSSKRFCTTDLLNAYQAGAVEMYNKIVNSIEKQTLIGLREDSQEWLKIYDK